MKANQLHKSLGTAALVAAVMLGVTPMSRADTRSERAAARAAAAADEQKKVDFDDLPGKVKETINKEKGRETIRSVYEVKRGDRSFYSVTLGAKNGDEKVLRVSPSGELLSAVDEGTGVTPRVRIANPGPDEQRPVKLGDLPDKVKSTVEKEKGKDKIKSIYEVKRNGRDFYSVVLEGPRGDEKIVRVGAEGELLSAVDEGTAAATPRARTNEVRPAAATSSEEGTAVNYDDLPGGVKTTIGREAGSYTNRKRVTEYQHRGQTVYRAVMSDGNRDKIIRVFPDGKVFGNEDATPDGGKEVKFDAFPYAPKVAVTKEAGAGQVTKAWQFTRDGKTHYRVILDDGRTFDTTDDGTIVKSEPNEPAKAAAGRRRG